MAETMGELVKKELDLAISKVKNEWRETVQTQYLLLRDEAWEAGKFDKADRDKFVILFDRAFYEVTPLMTRATLIAYIKDGLAK